MNLGLLEVQRLLGGEAAVPLPDAEQRVRGEGVGHLRLATLVLVHCLHTTNLSPHLCYSGSAVNDICYQRTKKGYLIAWPCSKNQPATDEVIKGLAKCSIYRVSKKKG